MALLEIIEGLDLTEMLGIQKYEKPLPGSLAGKVRGNFPSFIRKTDQERIQNLKKELGFWVFGGIRWEVTEKLDGSSMTVYHRSYTQESGVVIDVGVCSRNFDLAPPESEFYRENAFWQVERKLDIVTNLIKYGMNIALQGELVGPGVQGNKYGLTELDFYVFDIWDIDKQCYVSRSDRYHIVDLLGLKMVPVINTGLVIDEDFAHGIINYADGQSMIGNKSAREGLVFKSSCGQYSFKAISNKWLLKNED